MSKNSTPFHWIIPAALAGLAVALAVLFYFDPSRCGFYPTCLFHKTTGLLCPGCGGLRATHQLLHGNVVAAFHFNPLFVLSLPLCGWFIGLYALRKWRQRPAPAPSATWIWFFLTIAIAFSIWRNFPGSPFAMMH